MAWIENVFRHDTQEMYIHRHSMQSKSLPAVKAAWRDAAHKVLKNTGADHVIYCTVEYDTDNIPVEVNFYMEPLTDADFYERTDAAVRDAIKKGNTMFVGAVHKRT